MARFSELHEREQLEMYRDNLNDTYPMIEIGDLRFAPARVLEMTDETAFWCGYADYCDMMTEEEEEEEEEED